MGRSIYAKQLLQYILIILLISGGIGFLFFNTAKGHLEREVGRKLQYIARIGAKSTPIERLQLIRVGDDQTRMVRREKEKLQEIQAATGVARIGVFRPDGFSLLDIDDRLIGSRVGLPHLTAVMRDQLAAGGSVNTTGYLAAGDEFFISAYAPMTDAHGKLAAIVGVDAGAGELALISQMRSRLYLITFLCIAGAGLLALLFVRSITSPVRQMALTAERLGAGNYQARASVNSRDEVGILGEAINRMAEQVRARDAALKEMGASVAHEIRNPLNSIKLLIALLDEQLGVEKEPGRRKTIDTLHYEIGKLNRFIEEFLTYARPVTLIRDQVVAADLVVTVIDVAAVEASTRNVTLELAKVDRRSAISIDRLRMEQTLLNIVMNAIQACPDGGKVKVYLSRSEDDGGLDFITEDSGSGIEPDVLPHLFDPFFTTKADGTGLGLANARKIVVEHGGRIQADNLPAGGARFTIHLPADRLSPS